MQFGGTLCCISMKRIGLSSRTAARIFGESAEGFDPRFLLARLQTQAHRKVSWMVIGLRTQDVRRGFPSRRLNPMTGVSGKRLHTMSSTFAQSFSSSRSLGTGVEAVLCRAIRTGLSSGAEVARIPLPFPIRHLYRLKRSPYHKPLSVLAVASPVSRIT